MSDLLPPPSLPVAPSWGVPDAPDVVPGAPDVVPGAPDVVPDHAPDVHAVTPEPVTSVRRPRRTWWLWAAVLAVVVCGVGAVAALASGDRAAEAAPYSLAVAAEQASSADTVRFDMVMSVGTLGEFSMGGAVDRDAGLMTMSMDMGDVIGAGAGSMDMILDLAGGAMYVRAADLDALLPVDAEWISMDLETVATMSGQSLDDVRDQFGFDPAVSAELLLDHDPVEVGLEEIDGETVMHYQVSIDLTDVLNANPQLQQQLDESGLGLGADVPDAIAYDVWVTADNALRRLVFELPVMGDSVRTQLDVRAVDEELDVAIPNGDDVVDITDMLGF